MTTTEPEVYYDPYDFEIDADPYPVWKQLRDQRPLYHNERYDFYALSRFDDVERALVDWKTYSRAGARSSRSSGADMEMPRGLFIFEDPPTHDVHRSILSRVFTPRKMSAIEPQVREFCARSLDPLVGRRRLRLHPRSRGADAHAHHRDAARDPRGRPGGPPGP